jgi:hypothetical protein
MFKPMVAVFVVMLWSVYFSNKGATIQCVVNASLLGISNVLKFKSCACVYSITNHYLVNTFKDVSGSHDKKGHVMTHILKD